MSEIAIDLSKWDWKYGWICPKCGRVYSPTTSMCFDHGPIASLTADTSGTYPVSGATTINQEWSVEPDSELIGKISEALSRRPNRGL